MSNINIMQIEIISYANYKKMMNFATKCFNYS